MAVTRRNYSLLAGDYAKVKAFLREHYVPFGAGPFVLEEWWEYMHTLPWLVYYSLHRIGLWEDDGRLVAVAAYEMELGEAFLWSDEAYTDLYPELVAYAEERLSRVNKDGKRELIVEAHSSRPEELRYLEEKGYTTVWADEWPTYEFSQGIPEPTLPEGYRLVRLDEIDPADYKRLNDAIWQGFHNGEGEGNLEGFLNTMIAPSFRKELTYAAQDASGDFCGYGSAWFNPYHRYGYLEPLCVHPKHQRKGLASAIVFRLMRDLSGLGATYMTGGFVEFYKRIGYRGVCTRTHVQKTW